MFLRVQTQNEPFVLWTSIPDPHEPWIAPEKYASMFPPEEIQLPPWREGEFNERAPERNRVLHQILGMEDDPLEHVYGMMGIYYAMVRFLDNALGQILDALVACGSNLLYGISFEVEDPTKVYNQARSLAVEDARRRAELYALASGVLVGKVLAISEQSIETPRPPSLARGFAAEAVSPVPVAPGEHEFQISVNMVFALEDKP